MKKFNMKIFTWFWWQELTQGVYAVLDVALSLSSQFCQPNQSQFEEYFGRLWGQHFPLIFPYQTIWLTLVSLTEYCYVSALILHMGTTLLPLEMK